MSKFEDILSQYADVIEELAPAAPALDLTPLDGATGEQIQQGLAELMGDNQEQMNQVLQGLVNSKSINPNAAVAAPAQTQQAATAAPAAPAAPTAPAAQATNPAVTQPVR